MKESLIVIGSSIVFVHLFIYVLFFGYPEPFGFYAGIGAAACGIGIAIYAAIKEAVCLH